MALVVRTMPPKNWREHWCRYEGYWHQRADRGMTTLPKVTRSY